MLTLTDSCTETLRNPAHWQRTCFNQKDIGFGRHAYIRAGLDPREAYMSAERQDWRELCEAASKETDTAKLIGLVSELVEALDRKGGSPTREPREETTTR